MKTRHIKIALWFFGILFGLACLVSNTASVYAAPQIVITSDGHAVSSIKVGQHFNISVNGLQAGDHTIDVYYVKLLGTPDDKYHESVSGNTFSKPFVGAEQFVGTWRVYATYVDGTTGKTVDIPEARYEIVSASTDKVVLSFDTRTIQVGGSVVVTLSGLKLDDAGQITYTRSSDGMQSTESIRNVQGGTFTASYTNIGADLVGQWKAQAIVRRSVPNSDGVYIVTSIPSNIVSYTITSKTSGTGGAPTSGDKKSPDCQKCIDTTKLDCQAPPDNPDFCSDEAILNTTCASVCGGSNNPPGEDTGGLPVEKNGGDQTGTSGNVEGPAGIDISIDQVYGIIKGIACWLMRAAVAVIIVFVLFSGYKFLVSKGDAAKVVEARKNLVYVIIGIAVIAGVYVIIGTVATAIGAGNYSFFSCSSQTN